MALLVPRLFMVLHDRPRRHFLGPLAIAAGCLRAFLNMLVLSLLFTANSAKML